MGPVLAVLDHVKNSQFDLKEAKLSDADTVLVSNTIERLKRDGFIIDTEDDI